MVTFFIGFPSFIASLVIKEPRVICLYSPSMKEKTEREKEKVASATGYAREK
jgi:hypothetical protein